MPTNPTPQGKKENARTGSSRIQCTGPPTSPKANDTPKQPPALSFVAPFSIASNCTLCHRSFRDEIHKGLQRWESSLGFPLLQPVHDPAETSSQEGRQAIHFTPHVRTHARMLRLRESDQLHQIHGHHKQEYIE